MDNSQRFPLLSEDLETELSVPEDKKIPIAPSPIGVIGTGNFAQAVTTRLVSNGYRVVIGSRKPEVRRSTMTQIGDCLCGANLTTIKDCIRQCDVIIVAIHMENFKVTLEQFSGMAKGKILVDVSNRESRYISRSNAQYLSSVMPGSNVVKAFNTISVREMEVEINMSLEGKKVFVTSDCKQSRNRIIELSKSLGFQTVDFGCLKNSLHLEDFVLKVFPHWKIPIFLTFGIFNLWCLYVMYIYFIDKTAYKWEQIFLKIFNKPLCMTAITVLALTYLPGQIASILQVYRGTKHTRFPRILDTWLKSRKQFGLITFFLVCFHVIASTLMLSPTYYKSWFHQPSVAIPGNLSTLTLTSDVILPVSSSWMIWKGELALFFGITAFLTMSIQAVTSIQAVANVLNWSEWKCVQSNMGTYVLILATFHVISMGAPGWCKGGPMKTLGSITFLSLILPMTVLFIKFIFRFTPLRCLLGKIRKGWERSLDKNNTEIKFDEMTGEDIKKMYCYRRDNANENIAKCCDNNKLSAGEQLDTLAVVEEGGCCSGGETSGNGSGGVAVGRGCHCSGRTTKRDKTSSVRFAVNTNCDCSVV